MEHTEITPVKKRSGFKRGLMYLLILGVLGGSGYIAYQQGAVDGYLPQSLRAVAVVDEPPAPTPVVAAVPDVLNTSISPVVADVPATPVVATPTINAAVAPPVSIAINGASANALLSAYDAQWQWQMIEQSFKTQGDVTNTLQSINHLKTQLQSSNAPAFAPSLVALNQVETQLQAWTPLQTATHLTAIQQTLVDMDALVIKAAQADDIVPANVAEQTWWQRILASLKNVIAIKRIDEQKNTAALEASTMALVKQSIIARLTSAQLAAQTGQWGVAQSHARAAQSLAEQWSDASALVKIKPLLDVSSFPATPDFATVNAALSQARVQLSNEAHAAQSAPAETPAPKGGV